MVQIQNITSYNDYSFKVKESSVIKQEPSDGHPFIELNPNTPSFKIGGSSIKVDNYDQYQQVLGKLIPCLEENDTFYFHFNFSNLNSITVKFLFNIFKAIQMNAKNVHIEVLWEFESEVICKIGEDIAELFDIEVKFSPIWNIHLAKNSV